MYATVNDRVINLAAYDKLLTTKIQKLSEEERGRERGSNDISPLYQLGWNYWRWHLQRRNQLKTVDWDWTEWKRMPLHRDHLHEQSIQKHLLSLDWVPGKEWSALQSYIEQIKVTEWKFTFILIFCHGNKTWLVPAPLTHPSSIMNIVTYGGE